MQYQLSLWQTLAANFSSDNIIMSLIVLATQILLPIILFISLRKQRMVRNIVVTLCVVGTVGFGVYPIYGNGWKIEGKQLHMNAYGVSDTMNIADMKIDMVKLEGEWTPVRRDMGAGLPNLLAGKCTLANGKKALVFYYQNQEQMLLIEAHQKYYVIAYPGVFALYNDLVRLGAKEGTF